MYNVGTNLSTFYNLIIVNIRFSILTSMAAQTDPLQIQIPSYPGQISRDLPTAQDPPLDFSDDGDLVTVLTIPAFENNDDWTRDGIGADDRILPFPRIPANTCYRNAALAALMNLPPFISFLQRGEFKSRGIREYHKSCPGLHSPGKC